MQFNYPVYPIVPSFDENENFDAKTTEKYIKYLETEGAKVIMTTAGTSQFNLMNITEIRKLNDLTAQNFSKEKILGLPTLSTKQLIEEVKLLNEKKYLNTSIMLLFPDRFYHNQEIINWAYTIADLSIYPVFIHGMFMRNGTGGIYNFSSELYNELTKHKNIVGTKEETSVLSQSFNIVENIENKNFNVIVAGGSMRRFMFLLSAGATTFLTGVGSIFPKISELFTVAYNNNDLNKCKKIIEEYETPLFNTFMKIGWHPALRESLKLKGLCNENRKPFAVLTKEEKLKIEETLLTLENKIKKL